MLTIQEIPETTEFYTVEPEPQGSLEDVENNCHKLIYNPMTGIFTWRNSFGKAIAGFTVGSPHTNGYLRMRLARKQVYMHRLAWYIIHRRWPVEIDHVNGIKTDNRLENLREVTRSQNGMNKKVRKDSGTGIRGVTFNKTAGKYLAQISVNKKTHYLGYFSDPELAREARAKAEELYFGEHRSKLA